MSGNILAFFAQLTVPLNVFRIEIECHVSDSLTVVGEISRRVIG